MNLTEYTEFEIELAKLVDKYQLREIILISRHEQKVHHSIACVKGKMSEEFQMMSNMLQRFARANNVEEKNTVYFPTKNT